MDGTSAPVHFSDHDNVDERTAFVDESDKVGIDDAGVDDTGDQETIAEACEATADAQTETCISPEHCEAPESSKGSRKSLEPTRTLPPSEKFVAKIVAGWKRPENQGAILVAVRNLFSGRTSASVECRYRVAEELIDRFPRSELAANSEFFFIASRYEQVQELDKDLVVSLSDFSKNYPQSELPIAAYKWVGDNLSSTNRRQEASKLVEFAIKSSREHRDVSALENYYKIIRRSMLEPATKRNAPNQSQPTKPPKDFAFTSGKWKKLLGKQLTFSGRTIQGSHYSDGSIRGQWTVVHFWATWCKACRSFTPKLREVQSTWSRRGVQFIGISLDGDPAPTRKFVSDHSIGWPQVVDSTGGWDSPMAKRNGVTSLPAVFVIAPDGTIVEAGLRGTSIIDQAIGVQISRWNKRNGG